VASLYSRFRTTKTYRYLANEWWTWVLYALFVGLAIFAPELRGGYICDEYEQGYVDGYCSMVEQPICMPPMPPVCFENLYDNPRQAYHAGYSRGVREHDFLKWWNG